MTFTIDSCFQVGVRLIFLSVQDNQSSQNYRRWRRDTLQAEMVTTIELGMNYDKPFTKHVTGPCSLDSTTCLYGVVYLNILSN